MIDRVPLDHLTSDQLDALYQRIETLEQVAAGNKRHVQLIVPDLQRAEAAIARVRALAERWRYTGDRKHGPLTELLRALDEPGPPVAEAAVCRHCNHPADWHDEYEGCVGPNGIGDLGSGDCTCTRSPDTASAPAATEPATVTANTPLICSDERHTTKVADLERQLAALREVARGYCPACGRGDASPTVADWEQQRQRADQAEARLADYNHRITWHTTCANCARLLDSGIRETERATRAETQLDQVRALREDLAGITGARWIATALDHILNPEPGPAVTQATQPTPLKDTP